MASRAFSFAQAFGTPGGATAPAARMNDSQKAASSPPETGTLMVIVLVEALVYVGLRHFFRRSHGG